MAFQDQVCEGGKASKERITILITGNMAGDKEPLYVIGKSKNPRCFKGTAPPMPYHANTKAWMTSELFVDYVRKFDRKMARSGRHVALLLDNCPAHPHTIDDLRNVELIFLPANSTAKTQPMDAGKIYVLLLYSF